MTDPFITPENPLGEWNLPYEGVPGEMQSVTITSIIVDSVDVLAAVSDTPRGRLPVLVFDFHSSALPADRQPSRVTFIGTPDVIANLATLVTGACSGAIRAAGGEAA